MQKTLRIGGAGMSASSQTPGRSDCDEHHEQLNAEADLAPASEAYAPDMGSERGQRFSLQDWINALTFLLGGVGIFGFLTLMFSVHLLSKWADNPAVITSVALSGIIVSLVAGTFWVIAAFVLVVTMVTQWMRSLGKSTGKNRSQRSPRPHHI